MANKNNLLLQSHHELSSLIWHIPEHKVLIIDEVKNAHIGKNGNNKFYLHYAEIETNW